MGRHFYSALLTGEIWCSFLSTHAFLLGNGQTYATRGVPYFRVSRIFMSRIFSVPVTADSAGVQYKLAVSGRCSVSLSNFHKFRARVASHIT